MSAEIIQFIPRSNPNRHILDRIIGIPACVATAGSNRDPNNPMSSPGHIGADTAPSEYVAPEEDPA